MADKIAVVTGSNKGIGLAIVKGLLKRGVGTVYLTSRDVTRGKQAVEKLKKEGLNPQFHQLEVTNKESVKKFADFLKQKHGGIDILVNNAAIASNNLLETIYEEAKEVLQTNYNSILIIEEYMFPILNINARVINISSDCGHIFNLKNAYWIKRLTKPDLKKEDINAFVEWFFDSAKKGNKMEDDFQGTKILAYRVSKIAVSALTRVQQKEVGRNISVNSLHPGLVQTDMTKGLGLMSVDEVWEAPVYLALDIDQSVKGKYFWYDKTEKQWSDPNLILHMDRPDLKKYLDEVNFWNTN